MNQLNKEYAIESSMGEFALIGLDGRAIETRTVEDDGHDAIDSLYIKRDELNKGIK